MARAESAASMRVEVVYSPAPGVVECIDMEFEEGARVELALQQSGLLERHGLALGGGLAVGIWGKRCSIGDALHDGDRVEMYRPLKVDPKEARRRRDRKQRATCSPKR
jgi:putative ubiquitin-RnfH superfamily antitoxin RatB of RatAB toxin-antitoxin module